MTGQDKATLSAEIGKIPGPNKLKFGRPAVKNGTLKKDVLQNKNEYSKEKYLRSQKLANLDTILHQIFYLESRLRKEQTEIRNILAQRDQTILQQKQEIDKLKRENKKLLSRAKKQPEVRQDKIETDKILNKSVNDSIHALNERFGQIPKHTYNLYDAKESKKVCHKPPIAEKPKLNPSGYIVTTCALKSKKSSNKGCNIATTISQLLNEESDHGIVISSGSSEPSSPESTLKTPMSKVSKISRSKEKDSSEGKMISMDDHEVTSGYNSDSVSEQDHDYENICLKNATKFRFEERGDISIFISPKYIEEDRYSSSQPIYSNIEYAEKKLREGADAIEALNLQVGSVSSLENANLASKKKILKTEKETKNDNNISKNNVPRNRSNINQLMETEDKHVIMRNFEEFSLDSLDLESYEQNYIFGKENAPVELTRHSGDGAECKNGGGIIDPRTIPNSSSGGYENFLEATGLSQKSILTPSRMLSNHRSMLKPRDIKHRNKLRVYFTGLPTLEEGSICQSGSTSRKNDKKYWREPFL